MATHVVQSPNGMVRFAFSTPYNNKNTEFNEHLIKHGDGVKDVAYLVSDAQKVWDYAVSKGAKAVGPITKYEDENGSVLMGAIMTYGDTIHTLIQNVDYKGIFLPGF